MIVVGARCAGAATARLLAQRGHRTLIVDRAQFPSDMPMSTHLVWQAGASQLEKWGLLDRLKATGCPPIADVALDLGAFVLTGRPPSAGATAAYAPRRKVLDQLLLDAAVHAGAERRDDFMVEDVEWEAGRASASVARGAASRRRRSGARLVIGADGRTSTIARAVSAPAYNELPALQGMRFSYFRGVPMTGMEFIPGMGRMVFAWPTNDALTVVGIAWAIEDFRTSATTSRRTSSGSSARGRRSSPPAYGPASAWTRGSAAPSRASAGSPSDRDGRSWVTPA